MVGSLHQAGKLGNDDLESVIRAILGREELGSTGIGQGVAVPHTRHPTLHRLIGTVALSRRGVDFAALDGELVDIFFLLVSPQNQPGDHLRALENISRHLKDERFVGSCASAVARRRDWCPGDCRWRLGLKVREWVVRPPNDNAHRREQTQKSNNAKRL